MNFHLKRALFTLLLSAFLSTSVALGQERFTVTIEGKDGYLKSFQKRAELKLARSTKFCRGFTMPKMISQWKCVPTGEGMRKCSAKAKCGLINKVFSRTTETRRLREELKKIGYTRHKFPMIVSKKPLVTPHRSRYVDEIQRRRENERVAEERSLRKRIKERTQKAKAELTEYDEFAQLEKELDIETKKSTPAERREALDEFSKVTLAEDRKQLEGNVEGVAPFVLERQTNNSGDEEVIRIKRRDDRIPEDRTIQLLSFSTALTSIGDSAGNSVATVDVAWTPRWQFSPSLAARGRVGGHFYSVEIVEGEDPETFLIYDVAGELEWFPFEDSGWYATGSLGIQSWASTTGGAFSMVSVGAGYQFNFSQAKVFDRVFFNYSTVGNEEGNSELKLGVGITF